MRYEIGATVMLADFPHREYVVVDTFRFNDEKPDDKCGYYIAPKGCPGGADGDDVIIAWGRQLTAPTPPALAAGVEVQTCDGYGAVILATVRRLPGGHWRYLVLLDNGDSAMLDSTHFVGVR